jgi:hypothetical protein
MTPMPDATSSDVMATLIDAFRRPFSRSIINPPGVPLRSIPRALGRGRTCATTL